MGCVYLVTNLNNGMQYVGKTVRSLHRRKIDHYKEARADSVCAFHRALRKYPKPTFEWRVLGRSNNDKILLKKEAEYIQLYGTFGGGYNMTLGYDGAAGFRLSMAVRQQVSKRFKGKKQSLSHIEKRSKAMKGNKNALGHKHSPEFSKAISQRLKGHELSEEHKQKLSESLKKYHASKNI